ncbi:hypothetical protein [Microvirga sp. P5_D2]
MADDLNKVLADPRFTAVVQQVVHVYPPGRYEPGPDTLIALNENGEVERVIDLGVGGGDRWLENP